MYSGLSLSSGTLAGNSYVNFSISGAVEIPAILITIPLFNRYVSAQCCMGTGLGYLPSLYSKIKKQNKTNMMKCDLYFSVYIYFSFSWIYAITRLSR